MVFPCSVGLMQVLLCVSLYLCGKKCNHFWGIKCGCVIFTFLSCTFHVKKKIYEMWLCDIYFPFMYISCEKKIYE